MSDVESDEEGGAVYRTPIWRREEANKLIRRCEPSINKTQCYIETSEWGTSRVHRDIISEDKYLDYLSHCKIKLFFWNKFQVSLDIIRVTF